MKIKKIINYLFGFLVVLLFAIGFSDAEVIGISQSEWNSKPDSYWFSQSCDEVVWNEVYSGEYQIYLDNFENPSSNHGALYIWNYKVLTRGNYILYNNSNGGSAGNGLVIFNRDYLESINWKVNPGQTVRHLTTAEEVNGATFQWNWSFNTPYHAGLDGMLFHTPNFRSDGSHPNTPTPMQGNGYGDAEIRAITLYDSDNNLNTSSNNRAIVECWRNVIRRCGDGIVDTNHGETCDEGTLNGTPGHCNTSCNGTTTQNPQCSSTYNNQTQYTPDGSNWLSQNMNLCTIGSVTNFQISWNPGHSRHFTWNCTAGGNSTDCLAYQQWCGDGKVESNHGETCDEGTLNGTPGHCNASCNGQTPENPQCSSTYNNQTHYTSNGNNWLNQNMNLCTIGSISNFQISWNPGHSRHFTWNCNNNGQSISCLAYQQWCGDGKVESNHGEACDPADPTQAGRGNGGCSDYCQPVNVENPQCNSTYNGHTQYTPNSNLWLNNTMNLCTIGTLSNFSYSGTPRHFTWNCSAGGNTINCSANQQWCGDSQVNGSEQCDYNDPNHIGRGDGGCSHSCQPINNPTQPLLTIDKQVLTTGNLVAGDYVAYKITLKNIGLGVAHNAYIVDTLPLAIHYVSSNIQGVSNYLFDQWVDTNGQDNFKYYNFDLNPNQTATVYLTGVLRQGYSYEELTNCAYTSGAVDCVIIDMNPEPYLLKEQKTGGMTNFTTSTVNTQIGETITYKVNFQNVGSSPATGQVRDILPPCVKYVSSSIHGVNGAQGPTLSQQGVQDVVMYKNFKLNPGQAGYMLVVAEVKGNGVLGVNCSNITSYSNTGYFKFIGGNTLSSSVLAIRPENASSNVIFDKTGNKSIMYPGETGLEFYITVTNQGPNSISNIYVDDIRPDNESCIIYDGWTGTKIEEVSHLRRHYVGGSSNGGNGGGNSVGGRTNQNNGGNNAQSSQLSNGILYAGQSFNFTIFAHIANNPSCVGSYINTGKLTYTEGGSTHVLYDNYPFKVVATPNIKVSITKTVDKTYVHHGDTVTYTITYTNNGTAPLTNYVVRDYWPAMVEFLSSTPATNDIVATNEGTTITWHFNTPLAAGASATITAIGKVR